MIEMLLIGAGVLLGALMKRLTQSMSLSILVGPLNLALTLGEIKKINFRIKLTYCLKLRITLNIPGLPLFPQAEGIRNEASKTFVVSLE